MFCAASCVSEMSWCDVYTFSIEKIGLPTRARSEMRSVFVSCWFHVYDSLRVCCPYATCALRLHLPWMQLLQHLACVSCECQSSPRCEVPRVAECRRLCCQCRLHLHGFLASEFCVTQRIYSNVSPSLRLSVCLPSRALPACRSPGQGPPPRTPVEEKHTLVQRELLQQLRSTIPSPSAGGRDFDELSDRTAHEA